MATPQSAMYTAGKRRKIPFLGWQLFSKIMGSRQVRKSQKAWTNYYAIVTDLSAWPRDLYTGHWRRKGKRIHTISHSCPGSTWTTADPAWHPRVGNATEGRQVLCGHSLPPLLPRYTWEMVSLLFSVLSLKSIQWAHTDGRERLEMDFKFL